MASFTPLVISASGGFGPFSPGHVQAPRLVPCDKARDAILCCYGLAAVPC